MLYKVHTLHRVDVNVNKGYAFCETPGLECLFVAKCAYCWRGKDDT